MNTTAAGVAGLNGSMATSEPEIHPLIYTAVGVILGIIALVGSILNFLVAMTIVIDSKTSWTPVNVVLFNMVAGDFFVAVIGSPLAMVSAMTRGWFWDPNVCVGYAWFMCTLGMASIGNLTVMAVERWMLVTKPMTKLTTRHAILLSGCVWLYALSMSTPPLFGWGKYGPEAANVSCSVTWEMHDPVTHTESYIAYLFTFGLFLPVTTISASYIMIIMTLRRVEKRVGSRGKREAKVTKMVALMVIAFLASWSPYASMSIAVQYFDARIPATIAILPAVIAKSSICYNPVIYFGQNAQFVLTIKKCLGIPEAKPRSNESNTTTIQTAVPKTERIELHTIAAATN